ncbi:MAG: class I SAM-dependent methyltransferase [Gomphosphaeria aponina SAG 52.96 = DSM 107014]|uniref:Class I SAM-dependent methyltransferase n=1 Tax=Gomphosphaeria aponina SAG 52.96 = DSM 107014 TaxID=1521640 RepID=A0A941JN03_9CHRO|nr:class I SAM-dependent methyltransferase [Gomphosphaeria aponina SAG 52.96 = DSM 107014]
MEQKDSDLLEKIRQQFDSGPYPRTPLEDSPKQDIVKLYHHNLVTSYYLRNQQFITTEGKTILDAGCGSGYTTLILAEANPGAKIVGIDISQASLNLAQKRLEYHGFDNVEFHLLSLEDLPQLGTKFDYVNSDEVLYLLPDIVAGLKGMKSVLKPEGIIRTNLHNSFQRFEVYRGQSLFKMMGLMDETPGEMELEIVREFFKALKDSVQLKRNIWKPEYENDIQKYMSNYLLQGDKGYTIPELFSALRSANLEFISMVNWRQWDLMNLFQEPENLPTFLALTFPEISLEEKLHIVELIHPVNRLLDFWCGHPQATQPLTPIEEWTITDWQKVKVHLHPQLKTAAMQADLTNCINQLRPFEISKHLPIVPQQSLMDITIAASLFLPLLESPQWMHSLVENWQKLHPVHPLTLEPITYDQAFETIRQVLIERESFGYILLERVL